MCNQNLNSSINYKRDKSLENINIKQIKDFLKKKDILDHYEFRGLINVDYDKELKGLSEKEILFRNDDLNKYANTFVKNNREFFFSNNQSKILNLDESKTFFQKNMFSQRETKDEKDIKIISEFEKRNFRDISKFWHPWQNSPKFIKLNKISTKEKCSKNNS